MRPIEIGPFRVLADLGFRAVDPYSSDGGYLYLVMQRVLTSDTSIDFAAGDIRMQEVVPSNLIVDFSHGWEEAELWDGRPTVEHLYWRGALTAENAAAVVEAAARSQAWAAG